MKVGRSSLAPRWALVGVGGLAIAAIVAGAAFIAEAQDAASQSKAAPSKPPPARAAAPQRAAPAPAAPAPAAAAFDVTAQLREHAAGACGAQVNALAAGSMSGVATYNSASHWSNTAPEQRLVSVFLGQKFQAGPVPYGATGVIAAPNGKGGCDGVAVQIVPSPLPCETVRQSLAAKGRQIGDLAGVPLMEDASGQTMLVPTGANSCVLVGVRSAYGG